MKYTPIIMSFLCCSFMLHAADASNEPTPGSYHRVVKQAVAILDQRHPPTGQEYYLHVDYPRNAQPKPVKTVILKRSKGKTIDEALQSILAFDWKHGTQADAHTDSRKAAHQARYLALANDELSVTEQCVDEDGNLVTTFARQMPLGLVQSIYEQVPEIEKVEVYPG